MNGSLRQIGAGFLLGALSIAAVIGGFALSQAEGGAVAVPSPSASPSAKVATSYPTIPVLTDTPQPVATELISATPESTSTLPASLTPPPPPTSCLPPSGWLAIQIQGYETLSSLAQRYQTSAESIKQGNCLFSDQLVSGSYLYVPPRPTATFVPCGAPSGWVTYFVVSGDTLYNLSIRYRVPIVNLQRANCMGTSTLLAVGKPIKVPNVVTSTSSVNTPTWTASPTLEATTSTPTVNSPLTVTAEAQTAAAGATQTAAAAATQSASVAATQTAAALTAEAETQTAIVAASQTAAAATQSAGATLTAMPR